MVGVTCVEYADARREEIKYQIKYSLLKEPNLKYLLMHPQKRIFVCIPDCDQVAKGKETTSRFTSLLYSFPHNFFFTSFTTNSHTMAGDLISGWCQILEHKLIRMPKTNHQQKV